MKINMEDGMQRRTELLLGTGNMSRLREAKVIIFGVGGVGSWCAEALARTGIRRITIVDCDRVCISNCNRQLMATSSTIGQVKVEALRARLLDINPEAEIRAICQYYSEHTAQQFGLEGYDFVIDAIDSLQDKACLMLHASRLGDGVGFASSMGAARRIDPFAVRKAEFWKIKGDALARALRNRFKKTGQFPERKIMCVYSEEPPMQNLGQQQCGALDSICPQDSGDAPRKASANGSLCHVTAIFGMCLAGIAIDWILSRTPQDGRNG